MINSMFVWTTCGLIFGFGARRRNNDCESITSVLNFVSHSLNQWELLHFISNSFFSQIFVITNIKFV